MGSHGLEGFVNIAKYERHSISSSNGVPSCDSSTSPFDCADSLSPGSVALSPTDIKQDPDADYFGVDRVLDSPTQPAYGHELTNDANQVQKRPRGRPRKHPPKPLIINDGKANKGRSKTGCITCRRRKKKCDEAKPECT